MGDDEKGDAETWNKPTTLHFRFKRDRNKRVTGKAARGKHGKERKGRHERQRRHLSRGNEGWRERERGGACRPLNERKPKEAWMWRGKG